MMHYDMTQDQFCLKRFWISIEVRGLVYKVILCVSYLPTSVGGLGDTEGSRTLLEKPSRDDRPIKGTFQHHRVNVKGST